MTGKLLNKKTKSRGNLLFAHVKKAQIICAADQCLFIYYNRQFNPSTSEIRDVKPLAIFCGCTSWFMSDLVGTPKTGFFTTRLLCFQVGLEYRMPVDRGAAIQLGLLLLVVPAQYFISHWFTSTESQRSYAIKK